VHMEDINRALDAFFALMIEYPESKQAPKANYLIGYCEMLQGRFEEAVEAFNIVVQEYPQSDSASEARLYLDRIKNMTD
jgi:TolA-binding protein